RLWRSAGRRTRGMMTVTTADLPAADVRSQRIETSSLWQFAVFVAVLLSVVTPLLFLVLGSFSQPRLPSEFSFSSLGLANYIKVWSDPGNYVVLSNTLLF